MGDEMAESTALSATDGVCSRAPDYLFVCSKVVYVSYVSYVGKVARGDATGDDVAGGEAARVVDAGSYREGSIGGDDVSVWTEKS